MGFKGRCFVLDCLAVCCCGMVVCGGLSRLWWIVDCFGLYSVR